MFTGLIEEIGTIKNVERRGNGSRIEIMATKVLSDLQIDHSIAINGVCLTVVQFNDKSFAVDAVAETLAKSTFAQLHTGEQVNLERALRLQDRLGGHFVQGHVDGIGVIKAIGKDTHDNNWTFEIPENLEQFTIPKGSIAIDGVSLTIAVKNRNMITVSIIPHTMKQTIFKNKQIGQNVNIEVDFMAKYIQQFLAPESDSTINLTWLKDKGFY